MLQELMGTAVQYIDTAMVGSIGTHATAAVGSTTTINWLIGSSISAVGIGFLSYIAKAYGAGEKERAAKAAAQAVLVVLAAGSLLTAAVLSVSSRVPVWMKVSEDIRSLSASYFFILYIPMLPRTAEIIFGIILRASGDTKTPMRIGIGVNILNVLLNFLLIYRTRTVILLGRAVLLYGAGLGVQGAAAASAVSITFGGICMTAALWRHPELSPKGRSIKPDRQILMPCLKVAVPNMLQRFCTSLGYVVFASMINSLGQLSTAAHTIANTVESAFYIPGYGMMTAAATLTGNAVGAKDSKRMNEMATVIIVLEVSMMVVSGTLLFLFAPAMAGLFSKDEDVIRLAGTVLRMVALSEPFYGISIVTEGMLQGAGQTKMPFVFNVLCMWGIRIAGTYLCIRLLGLGLISAWGCMIGNNMLLLVMFRLYFRFGKWRKELETAV
jgi:putative MATE family efflux protein